MAENEVLNIAQQYAAAVRKVMSPNAVILYGSHANGTATTDSDIDIAVVIDAIQGDYLTTLSQLWNLTNRISDIIEPVLLTQNDRESGFLQTVQKTGISL